MSDESRRRRKAHFIIYLADGKRKFENVVLRNEPCNVLNNILPDAL